MKALTIKNPWALLIAHGVKPIENRTWKTNFRGPFLIHTSQKPIVMDCRNDFWPFNNRAQIMDIQRKFNHKLGRWPDVLTSNNGCIIGQVDLIDCVQCHPSVWAEHKATKIKEVNGEKIEIEVPVYNWVLANPVLYDKPIENVKGALSLWEYHQSEFESLKSKVIIGCELKVDVAYKFENGYWSSHNQQFFIVKEIKSTEIICYIEDYPNTLLVISQEELISGHLKVKL